jgi:hypothetical protein
MPFFTDIPDLCVCFTYIFALTAWFLKLFFLNYKGAGDKEETKTFGDILEL